MLIAKRVTVTSRNVTEVLIVRARVWLIDRSIISGVMTRFLPRFSRMRSKTTTVSFTEYPTSVRNAATIGRLIFASTIPSMFATATMPSVIATSWKRQMTAARPMARLEKRNAM